MQRRGVATPATASKSKPQSVQRERDMFAKKENGKQSKKAGPKPALQAAAAAQKKAVAKASKAAKAGKVINDKPKNGNATPAKKSGKGGNATPGKGGQKTPGKGGQKTPSKSGQRTPGKAGLGLNVKTPKGVSKRKQEVQGKSALAVALQGGGSFNPASMGAPRENIRISIGAPAAGSKNGGNQAVMGIKTASRARASALQNAGRVERQSKAVKAKRANQANARRGLIKPGRDVPAGVSAASLQRGQGQQLGGGNGRKGGNKGGNGGGARLRQPGIRKL